MNKEYVISLTTIPSRIMMIEPVIKSLLDQLYPPKIIYINLPKKYNRFKTKITIPKFLSKYENVKIFYVDTDYGPATKFIGSLINPTISPKTIIIVTDDDVIKKKNWSQLMLSYYDKNRVTSFVEKKLGNKIIWGYLGYIFRKDLFNVTDMLYFYKKVKCECILVDDHWLTGYCHYRNIEIYNIPITIKENINIKNNGYPDALVKINGNDSRLNVSEKCRRKIKKEFNTEFPFWCCIGCCKNGKRLTYVNNDDNKIYFINMQINTLIIILCICLVLFLIQRY